MSDRSNVILDAAPFAADVSQVIERITAPIRGRLRDVVAGGT